MVNQDRETPGRGRPGRDRTAQDRDRTAQGRDRTAQDRDGTAQSQDRTAQDETAAAQGRDRTAQNWERPSGGADLVSDDLWSPLWPTSSADRGSRARRMPASAEREPARGPAPRPGRPRSGQRRTRAPPRGAVPVPGRDRGRGDRGRRRRGFRRHQHAADRPGAQVRHDVAVLARGEQGAAARPDARRPDHRDRACPSPAATGRPTCGRWRATSGPCCCVTGGSMDFLGGRPPLGPNTLLNLDRSLALLDGIGLDVPTAMNILMTVLTYVMGAALREMRETRVQREQEQSGIDRPPNGSRPDRLAEPAGGRRPVHPRRQVPRRRLRPRRRGDQGRAVRVRPGLRLDGIAAKVPALS